MEILLTGASGFIGKAIYENLSLTNNIITLGRKNQKINCDLANKIPDIGEYKIEKVLHLAGYAHVKSNSPQYNKMMYDVNLNGTINLLRGLDELKIKPNEFIYFSSVSVYGCDSGDKIDEKFELRATDPYGLSKILAEKEVIVWCEKFNIPYLILRIPLVVGQNPPGNLAKMIEGIKCGKYLSIGGGNARKSMVLLSDLVNLVSKPIKNSGIFNITDANDPSFREVEVIISRHYEKNILKVPLIPFRLVGYIGDFLGLIGFKSFPVNSQLIDKMTKNLTFSCEKAKQELDWNPEKVTLNFPL